MTYKFSKLGQTDLSFGLRSEFTTQDYKSLWKAVMIICATLVNTQTDIETDRFDRLHS